MGSRRFGASVLVLCLLVVALGGCRAPNLQDRMDDAGEIFRLNFGLGPGFLVNAHATRFVGAGLGAYDSRRYGFRDGYGWVWDERRYDFNLGIPIWGWEDVDSVVYGGMPLTMLRGDAHDRYAPGVRWYHFPDMPLTIRDRNRGWLEVSANVHLIWVGVDVGVDAGEFLDYLFGWFGVDLASDDAWTGEDLEKHDSDPVPPGPGVYPDTVR